MVRAYYQLTKPGIIYANALTAVAGFLFAAKGHIDFVTLFGVTVGTSLVIAAACVCNNCIDRNIDQVMARTKKRALVTGEISIPSAILYAIVLAILGFGLLVWLTNMLVVGIGAVAFIDYVVLYGYSKRKSVWGTVVGSVSGAASVVAGYVAVTDRFDAAALILFLILVFWQMPHFYAIAMYRLKDYKAAGIPVLPAVKGLKPTKIEILAYIVAFAVAVASLTIFGYAGYTYLVVLLGLSVAWLWLGIRDFNRADDVKWGRTMFFFSLVVNLAISAMLAVGSILI